MIQQAHVSLCFPKCLALKQYWNPEHHAMKMYHYALV